MKPPHSAAEGGLDGAPSLGSQFRPAPPSVPAERTPQTEHAFGPSHQLTPPRRMQAMVTLRWLELHTLLLPLGQIQSYFFPRFSSAQLLFPPS